MAKKEGGHYKMRCHQRGNFLFRSMFLMASIIVSSSFLFAAPIPDLNKELTENTKQNVFKSAFKLQMPFIENQGQIKDKNVQYYTRTFYGSAYVTDKGEIVYLNIFVIMYCKHQLYNC